MFKPYFLLIPIILIGSYLFFDKDEDNTTYLHKDRSVSNSHSISPLKDKTADLISVEEKAPIKVLDVALKEPSKGVVNKEKQPVTLPEMLYNQLKKIKSSPQKYVGDDELLAILNEQLGKDEQLDNEIQQVIHLISDLSVTSGNSYSTSMHLSNITELPQIEVEEENSEVQQNQLSSIEEENRRVAQLYGSIDPDSIAQIIMDMADKDYEHSLGAIIAQGQHQDANVRLATVNAISTVLEHSWENANSAINTLEELAKDPIPDVANSAKEVLNSWSSVEKTMFD
jgi:hypothetical protein